MIALTVVSPLFYGGLGGAVLAGLTCPVKIWHGIGMGALLWLVMGLAVLPFVGWGFFGLAITSMIAVNALFFPDRPGVWGGVNHRR